jgi:hypothetical protein
MEQWDTGEFEWYRTEGACGNDILVVLNTKLWQSSEEKCKSEKGGVGETKRWLC